MKNLENYGVVSLDNKEIDETNGGSLGLIVFAFILGYFIGMGIGNPGE